MDGYSVQEAASVLGVAEGRVWELLARGVLLGTPEGDSMRVFLKAQPPSIVSSGARDEAPRVNGNGGSHPPDGEGSAFRELLTEFRNLTERYGQALLALGEARGEVAGLRSRVDLLEARLDLRLPPPMEPAPVAWESTTSPAPPAAPQEPGLRRGSRSRKARSARKATASFADALARALDPSAADLGPSPADSGVSGESVAVDEPTQAAKDLDDATAFEDVAETVQIADAVDLVDEVTAEVEAETIGIVEPIPDETVVDAPHEPEAPTYSTVVVEPDWFADGDFAWLDAADHEPPSSSEPPVAVASETGGEPPQTLESPTPDTDAEPTPEPVAAMHADAPREPVPEEKELTLPPLPGPLPVPALDADTVVEPSPEPDTGGGQTVGEAPDPGGAPAPPDRTAAEGPGSAVLGSAVALQDLEEEIMWLGAEPSPGAQREPPTASAGAAEPWPTTDTASPATDVARPPLAMTEDELARLALDEGWDEAEVAAIRAMITPVPDAPVNLPGAAELHEAMAALEAVPVRVDPAYDARRQWAKPTSQGDVPAELDDWVFGAEPAPPAPEAPRTQSDVTSALRRGATDPGWLRRRQGPAAAAYRRLRRLLPG